MILLIECEIESDTLLANEIEYRFNSYLVKLFPNELRKLSRIAIERPFPDYLRYIPRLIKEPGKSGEIKLPVSDFFPEQIELFQYLESFAALDLGVKKIRWEEPYIKWIPENEDDQAALTISGYSYKDSFPDNNRRLTKKWLEATIRNRNMAGHLKELLTFYRLGTNFYFDKLYILSFLNFFLMLEGAFGNGKTDKKHTIAAFMQADHLVSTVKKIFVLFESPIFAKHKQWFESYRFDNDDLNIDPVRKMINILYDQRGLLSHYSMTSYRKRNEFDQNSYQSIAFVAMTISKFCADKLRIDQFRIKSEQ
jgi:hypothetical protein